MMLTETLKFVCKSTLMALGRFASAPLTTIRTIGAIGVLATFWVAGRRFNVTELAKDLIGQAKEQFAYEYSDKAMP